MANPNQQAVHSFLTRTRKEVTVGQYVIILSEDPGALTWVAKVDNISLDRRNRVRVRVKWLYRPEQTRCGRLPFQGQRELLLGVGDDYETLPTHQIYDKCKVHIMLDYLELARDNNVLDDDFFCRFRYNRVAGRLTPRSIELGCICYSPFNPDKMTVKCELCNTWFHLSCLHVSLSPPVFDMVRFTNLHVCDDCA